MKTKDLTPGLKVAWKRWKHSDPEPVFVVATGVARTTKNTWHRTQLTRGNVTHDGVQVSTHKDGRNPFVVRAAELSQPWAEWKVEQKAAEKAKAESKAAEAARLLQNATLAKQISDAALANGLPPHRGYTYDDDVLAAMLAAGFAPDEPRYKSEGGTHFKGAFDSYYGVVKNGELPLDAVAVAMGLTAAPAPTEHDDYSAETIAAETEEH